jgi:hypothetical protein
MNCIITISKQLFENLYEGLQAALVAYTAEKPPAVGLRCPLWEAPPLQPAQYTTPSFSSFTF